jgi:hypothetical protein
METAVNSLASTMVQGWSDSTDQVGKAFATLADAVIREITKMIFAEVNLQRTRQATAAMANASASGSGGGGGILGGSGGGGGGGLIGGFVASWVSGLYNASDNFAFRTGGHFPMQSGGEIPGPQGAPRLILGHGGERVVTPTGRGGAPPMPSGGNGGVSLHFSVGVMSADTIRNTQRSYNRMIGSAGAAPFSRR